MSNIPDLPKREPINVNICQHWFDCYPFTLSTRPPSDGVYVLMSIDGDALWVPKEAIACLQSYEHS